MKPSAVLGLFGVVMLAACDAGGNIVGEWEAVLGEDATTLLTFAADSTFTMDTGQFVGEGRYTLTDDDVTLEPVGALATVVPGGFTGEVTDFTTMNICSPSGVCTEFTKR